MNRLPFALASLLVAACGSSDPVLTDEDSGSVHTDGGIVDTDGSTPDAGTTPDGGAMPDGGTMPDAGPPPPACGDETWTPPADPSAGAWDTHFHMPGVGGTSPADALALAIGPSDEIYVAGQFSHAGAMPARNIVKWTEAGGWEPLGDGLDGDVTAVAVHPSGAPLYAAARSSSTFETGVYVFDGTDWTLLTTVGGIGNVHDLDVGPDGTLYVAGLFDGAGGDPTLQNFAVYDGLAWSGLGGNPDSEVLTTLVSSTEVCIGGHFSNVGATPAQNVACYAGGTWSPYDLPLPFYQVRVLARDSAGALYAGGHFSFDESDASRGGSIARWGGTSWELIGGGVHSLPGAPGYVDGITFAGSDLYVTGYFVAAGPTDTAIRLNSVARWDGTAWHDVGGGAYRDMGFGLIEQNVRDILVDSTGRVFIAGMFTSVGTKNASHVAYWDGAAWQNLVSPGQLGQGVNGNVLALASRGDCGLYVGGSFRLAGDIVANNVARYDGSGWHALGLGLDGPVSALAVDADGGLYAGGDFVGPGFYNIGYFRGGTWASVGNASGSITVLAIADDGTVYAGGDFEVIGSATAAHVAAWDGSTWSALGDGLDGVPYAMTFDTDGTLVVTGQFSAAGGTEALNVARWDGSAWSAIGGGLPGTGPHRAVTLYDGQLVVAGDFDALADGGLGVATFDGTDWVSLGGGLYSQYDWSSPRVTGLGAVGGALFAAGDFSMATGEDPVRVGWYDGSTWRTLGAGIGLTDIAETVLANRDGVWIGGTFTKADDTPSVAIARWQYPE